jgi:Arabinose efflux permease
MQITHSSTSIEISAINGTQPKKELPRALQALSYRNFRLFWFSQIVSLMGSWMQTTGQAWLVLQLTHNNALWLGIDGALQFLPVLILGLFSGVIADRFPKRLLLIGTQTTYMVLAVILCVLVGTHTVQLWQVLTLSTFLGITNSLDMPVRQSFVVEMVGRKTLPNAIALNSSSFNVARIIGPSVAGLLIAWFGLLPLFVLNAISFLPVIAAVSSMRDAELHYHPQKQSEDEKQGVFKSLGEGFAYVKRTPAVFLIIATVGIVSLFGANFNVVLPLFATSVLHSGSEGFGLLSSTFGIGALLAALSLAIRSKKPRISFMIGNAFLFSVFEAIFALSHLYVVSLILIAIVGFNMISFAATANSAIQSVTPGHLRGRIMGVYMTVFTGTTPIGNLLTGGLANAFGATITLAVMAGVSIIAAIIAWLYRKPAEHSLNVYQP